MSVFSPALPLSSLSSLSVTQLPDLLLRVCSAWLFLSVLSSLLCPPSLRVIIISKKTEQGRFARFPSLSVGVCVHSCSLLCFLFCVPPSPLTFSPSPSPNTTTTTPHRHTHHLFRDALLTFNFLLSFFLCVCVSGCCFSCCPVSAKLLFAIVWSLWPCVWLSPARLVYIYIYI